MARTRELGAGKQRGRTSGEPARTVPLGAPVAVLVECQLGGNRAFPQTHQTRKRLSSPSGTTGLGTLSGHEDTRRPGNTAGRMDERCRQPLGSSRLVTGHPQVRLPRHTTCRGLKSRTLKDRDGTNDTSASSVMARVRNGGGGSRWLRRTDMTQRIRFGPLPHPARHVSRFSHPHLNLGPPA